MTRILDKVNLTKSTIEHKHIPLLKMGEYGEGRIEEKPPLPKLQWQDYEPPHTFKNLLEIYIRYYRPLQSHIKDQTGKDLDKPNLIRLN